MGIDAQMFARTFAHVTEDQVKHWSWELGAAFGPRHFTVGDWSDRKHRALRIVDSMWEDSVSGYLSPDFGETFIEVGLGTRYYGVGYERGDLPTILNVAVYLERKIPGATVWYGGDSSGVKLQPLDSNHKTALWNHFVDNGHLPYVDGFDKLADKDVKRPLCPICEVPMSQYGFGSGYAAYNCLGCGKTLKLRDGVEIAENPSCPRCMRPYANQA